MFYFHLRFPDLSHDTDVNYKPNRPRLTREEGSHIEVLDSSRYVPLNDLENLRKKREHFLLNKSERISDHRLNSLENFYENQDEIGQDSEDFFTTEMFHEEQFGSSGGNFRVKREIVKEGTTFKPLFIEDMPGVLEGTRTAVDAPVEMEGIKIRIEGLRIEDSAKVSLVSRIQVRVSSFLNGVNFATFKYNGC